MAPKARVLALVSVAATGAAALALYLYLKRKVIFLVAKQWKKAQIIDILDVSEDTKRFRLSLGSRNAVLGLPVGKHLVLRAPNPCGAGKTWNGSDDVPTDKGKGEIERKYTPVTGNETPGYVDLVIKVYHPGTVRMPDGKEVTWVDGGKMGLFLDCKKVGDYVDVMGPLGVNEYLGRGKFKLPGRQMTVKRVGMMAGGTGLTPMLQVLTAALRDPEDQCKFSLVYANKTESDILCRDMLDELMSRSQGRFKVTYTLQFPPANWKHKQGFITKDMIQECLPAPSPETLILMCGPPPMVKFACRQNLEALQYPKAALVEF